MSATALTPIRPALGLVGGGEYQPYTIYPEQPGAVFSAGDFLQVFTTGTILTPTPAGSISAFIPTSAPTITETVRSGEQPHTLFVWYSLTGTGGQGVLESQLYEVGPLVNPSGNSVTINVPADGNYPAAATHFLVYVGTLPGQMWLQTSTTGTALGSTFELPAYPLTNNTGVNRSVNNPASGVIGYAAYDAGTGYAQREGDILAAGYNWRALFGVDQSLSGNQALLEQYQAAVVKLSGVPVTISLLQAWAGQVGTSGNIVYSTTYGVFYLDTTQSNSLFVIDRPYGGLAGPYNPNGVQPGNTYQPIVGHWTGGLA